MLMANLIVSGFLFSIYLGGGRFLCPDDPENITPVESRGIDPALSPGDPVRVLVIIVGSQDEWKAFPEWTTRYSDPLIEKDLGFMDTLFIPPPFNIATFGQADQYRTPYCLSWMLYYDSFGHMGRPFARYYSGLTNPLKNGEFFIVNVPLPPGINPGQAIVYPDHSGFMRDLLQSAADELYFELGFDFNEVSEDGNHYVDFTVLCIGSAALYYGGPLGGISGLPGNVVVRPDPEDPNTW